MNLKQLKLAFDISDGDLYFVADDSAKQAIKKKLTTPPLQGVVDITIKKREDGMDIVFLPKSKKNIYAFEHLLVIDPKEDVEVVESKPKSEAKEDVPKGNRRINVSPPIITGEIDNALAEESIKEDNKDTVTPNKSETKNQ